MIASSVWYAWYVRRWKMFAFGVVSALVRSSSILAYVSKWTRTLWAGRWEAQSSAHWVLYAERTLQQTLRVAELAVRIIKDTHHFQRVDGFWVPSRLDIPIFHVSCASCIRHPPRRFRMLEDYPL